MTFAFLVVTALIKGASRASLAITTKRIISQPQNYVNRLSRQSKEIFVLI